MRKQTFQIEKMPFFEKFEGTNKAVIFMDVFEKWLQETLISKSSSEVKKRKKLKSNDFYGIFKSNNPEYVKQITEDKEVFYDI